MPERSPDITQSALFDTSSAASRWNRMTALRTEGCLFVLPSMFFVYL